jgi:hypothetical protein
VHSESSVAVVLLRGQVGNPPLEVGTRGLEGQQTKRVQRVL